MNLEQRIEEHAQAMAEQMPEIAASAKSEEDVRHAVNNLIDDFITKAKLEIRGRHEYDLVGGRVDSKYGGVIIEYKNPHGPDRITEDAEARGTRKVVAQIQKRFRDFQKQENIDPSRIFGVGCDGDTLVFVRRRGGKYEVEAPQPVTSHTVTRLLRAIVSLGAQGMSFTPEHLTASFGADSELAREGLRDIYAVITETDDPKALTFFKQWKIQFSEVCGYDVEGHNPKIEKLGEHYGVPSAEPANLLFSLHTYYAIFMKFLAAEIVSSFSPLGLSVIKRCVGAPSDAVLLAEMQNLEQGGIWTQLGVVNFLEGDLFSWYISAWNERIARVVRGIVGKLDQFDPTTLSVEPAESHDLLKKLYQNLFPNSVRHDLGEYYTPDWLAEHVLNELGYEGDPDKRLLDPACGSGTFLVIAINRIKSWFAEHRDQCGYCEDELLQKILHNVIGFDLNPLAVMAARTNYLMAIRDLFQFAGQVELPVYMCDSIMTPAEYGGLMAGERADRRVLHTAAGDFDIPTEITTDRQQLGAYADALDFCVRDRRYETDEFLTYCENQGLPVAEANLHRALYEKLCELDAQNKNGIWARIIKNAFAPLFIEPVDYVAGNPPWVRWGYLPQQYRTDIKHLWRHYDLLTQKGLAALMGTAELDISMLFTYVCIDTYLRDGGRLGFLITQEVVRSKGAGEGFRRFCIVPTDTPLKAEVFHDMVALKPFEAANKTALIVLVKDAKNEYPVRYTRWRKLKGRGISPDDTLRTVLANTLRIELQARPLHHPMSPWQVLSAESDKALPAMAGKSAFKGRCGVSVDPYGVFLCKLLSVRGNDMVVVINDPFLGKSDVPQMPATAIEAERVFPVVRGRDIRKWCATPEYAAIIINSSTRKADIPPEHAVKSELPRTYAYLSGMKSAALGRAKFWRFFAQPHTSRQKLSEQAQQQLGQYVRSAGRSEGGEFVYEVTNGPFYTLFNVGTYTFAPFKVVWPMGASDMRAAVVHLHRFAVDEQQTAPKPVVPATGTTAYVAFDEQDAAHYLCAVLNSTLANAYIRSFSSAGRGFGAPSVVSKFNIPDFDGSIKLHRSLSDLSRRCHEAAAQGDSDTVAALEAEIDRAAAKLWDITDDDLKAIQDALQKM